MVNGAPREFPREYSMYSLGRRLKVPQGIFQRRTRGHIQGQTKGQKPEGPQAPRVSGLRSGRGCGQRMALRKFRPKGAFNILPREYTEYSRELPRAPFTMIPPRLSYRFSIFLPNELLDYVKREKQTNKLFSNATLRSRVV